jgi:Zn-finger nucleic acid-binding protein
MNCNNCGAPMVLFRERDFYRCEHCGSFHFPSSSPDGVRLVGENPEGIKCPLCDVVLQMATFDDHYRGYRCDKCRGLLFLRQIFAETVQARRTSAVAPIEVPAEPNPEELRRKLACPACSRTMSTYRYLGPGNIVIDTCETCDLIWLDYRELEKVVRAPGRDRGGQRRAQTEVRWQELPESAWDRPMLGSGVLSELLDYLFTAKP